MSWGLQPVLNACKFLPDLVCIFRQILTASCKAPQTALAMFAGAPSQLRSAQACTSPAACTRWWQHILVQCSPAVRTARVRVSARAHTHTHTHTHTIHKDICTRVHAYYTFIHTGLQILLIIGFGWVMAWKKFLGEGFLPQVRVCARAYMCMLVGRHASVSSPDPCRQTFLSSCASHYRYGSPLHVPHTYHHTHTHVHTMPCVQINAFVLQVGFPVFHIWR